MVSVEVELDVVYFNRNKSVKSQQYAYYIFAVFADLNHSDLFTNNHVIICKESHVI